MEWVGILIGAMASPMGGQEPYPFIDFGFAFSSQAECEERLMSYCPSSDNLGQLSVLPFGGSGSSLIEVMRFPFGGASAA